MPSENRSIETRGLPRGLEIRADCTCGTCMYYRRGPAIRLCEPQARRLHGMLGTMMNRWDEEDAPPPEAPE